jgi:hypothetical protein
MYFSKNAPYDFRQKNRLAADKQNTWLIPPGLLLFYELKS